MEALEAIAADAISHVRTLTRPDVEPFHWALYGSKHVPDADEVRLELSLPAAPGVDGPEQVARERPLGELRRVLETLGVVQGSHKGGPAVRALERPEAPEQWIERPAAQAFGPRAVPVPA